ncbi:2-succinyl-6-hydroxy-2,4-cyclohexadiene-1-carboxylate synthase [Ferrimonas balearica]|uniref:2-succinyl-6-hydroxy-2, 4-cyclohexadiene-1-carboxylate synthase n=1 Tax=Ferrimonas balearica TaxID=44012 RepID=UPI001C99CF9F|nr:2-succinyl-6-hydroxy-2,4-cyclohexadiene-1-carboxylate synthase [Ferrimonas balearica]MBY5994173.1 2-succinyl-6-hydroxy-2,4-cyclohexadiene-1-carboxylate synthase [Ferrimonas balearica]
MTEALGPLSGRRWGQGAPLVLLHGFLGDHRDWPEALGEGFDCLALDLPGHGLSRHCPLDSLPAFETVTDLLLASLDTAGYDRFHLLGYSLGGRLALHLAQRAPGRLLSLTLESAHPGLTELAQRRARLASDGAWHQRMQSEPVERWLDAWYQQGVFADLDPDARAALVAARRHNDPQALAALYLGTSLGHQGDLRALPCPFPAQLLTGEQDSKFTTLARQWQQAQPHWQHRVIPGAGHNIHRARPDAFLATLRPLHRIR